jgi:monoterpene epsilon-lactone hydrolase
VAVTRETIRSFMGYSSSLPIDEFRSIEVVLDDLCGRILPPVVRSLDVETRPTTVAGVPGIWYRPRGGPPSGHHPLPPRGRLRRHLAPDVRRLHRLALPAHPLRDLRGRLRLAPEFPFPAGLEDAVLVLEALLAGGIEPDRLFVAGDSSGGGLAAS